MVGVRLHWWYLYIGGNSTHIFLLAKIDLYSEKLVFESEMAMHKASNPDI